MRHRSRICSCCGRHIAIGTLVAGDRIHLACKDVHLLGLIRELARSVDALSADLDAVRVG